MDRSPSGGWLPANTTSFPSDRSTVSAPPAPSSPPASPASGNAPSSPAATSPGTTRRTTFSILMAAVLVSGMAGGAAGSALTASRLGHAPLAPQTVSAAPPVAAQTALIGDTGLAAIYKQVNPAVVSVETAAAVQQTRGGRGVPGTPGFPNAPSLPGSPNGGNGGQNGQGPDFMPSGEGTGFIIDGDGDILTNNHVVSGAGKLTVVLADGSRLPAEVVGTDPGSDVAVIRASIPAGKAAIATLGDSDAIEPGAAAIAIGTPFGLDHTITAGIVSGVNRDFGTAAGRPMRGLIQTDAAINPGNSGGPLLNGAGEVIGITTSIESPVRANVGVGFAIPINQVKRLLPQLKSGQKLQHAWLGISGAAVTADSAADLGVPASAAPGVGVIQVAPNSPAASAGLRGGSAGSAANGGSARAGDVIVAVDGHALTQVQDLSSYLDTKAPGDTVTLTIVRDGSRQDVHITLAPWPETTDQ